MILDTWMLPVLAFLAVVSLGAAVLLARALQKDPVQVRLRELEPSGYAAAPPSSGRRLLEVLSRLGTLVAIGGPSVGLKAELARAGFHGWAAPRIYFGAK